MNLNRLFQGLLITVLIVLIGYWAISFIKPVSEAGFPTTTFQMLAKVIVWAVGIVVGGTYILDEK